MPRMLKYSSALNEALTQKMEADPSVMLCGSGVSSPWFVGHTCDGLLEKFGKDRVWDTPIAENAVASMCIGFAINGFKPVLMFPRHDFLLYAMDPIINGMSKWHYLFRQPLSIVIWTILNRGGAQGPHHSQDFTEFFLTVPGLKLVRPQNPYEAKGMLIASIEEPNPVIFVDDRWLYNEECEVPEEMYRIDRFWTPEGCPVPCASSLERAYYGQTLEGPVRELWEKLSESET